MSLLWAGLDRPGRRRGDDRRDALRAARRPAGSYFEDGDRASGVFGVLSTGFAILLGFVVFLAFESYDTSRSGAEAEAQIVDPAVRDGAVPPARLRARRSRGSSSVTRARVVLRGVAADAVGHAGTPINPWSVAMFQTLQRRAGAASEQTAYGKWLDQRPTARSPGPIALTAPRA